MDRAMKTRVFGAMAFVAMVASVAGSVWLQSSIAHPPRLHIDRLAGSPVGGQLPRGFTLPSGDADLQVSSLVTTDLDADGDLDIVAADRSSGAIGIVVWVNDGAGRLTRKAPAPAGHLASEPAAPTIDEHQATVMASVQPNGPAIAAISAKAWFALPARPHNPATSAAPDSATAATLRSRSPPARS
jgi:hypothetical protein